MVIRLTSRHSRVTAYVDAEVSVSMQDISTEDLVEELKTRDDAPKAPPYVAEETLYDLLSLLKDREVDEAIILIERLVRPKWRSREDAEAAYKTAVTQPA